MCGEIRNKLIDINSEIEEIAELVDYNVSALNSEQRNKMPELLNVEDELLSRL